MTDIQITGFEMLSKLGEGGMASVWKARQVSLDRTVAIKILSSHFASDQTDIKRFQQEAQSAAKLKHPGIVQVYDANIENGLYFFVMEFVDGYTCADWLGRKGQLEESNVLLIAECVTDALGYAWERERIIHCDIKPDNIMIDEDGTVKVTDLGLSKTISGMSVDEESDEILGTPAYMSPEQAMGEANQDSRLDMYSLGAMMYHLATGKLLFEDDDPSIVMEKQVNDTVANPRDLKPSLSKGFCRLIEVLMSKEKEGRPAEWQDVKDAIARVKKGHTPKLRLPAGVTSTVRKSEAAQEAAAQARLHSDQSTHSVSEPPKKSPLPIILGAIGVIIICVIAAQLVGKNKGGSRQRARQAAQSSQSSGGTSTSADQMGRSQYYEASNWEKRNRGAYEKAIARYEAVIAAAPSSKYAERSKNDIGRLQEAQKKNSISDAIDALDARANALTARHAYDSAIGLYRDYTGPEAESTLSTRTDRIATLEQKKRRWEEAEKQRIERAEKARFDSLMQKVAGMIIEGHFSEAAGAMEDASIARQFPQKDDQINELRSLFDAAAGIDNKIMASFTDDIGREVSVNFMTGPKDVTVDKVDGTTVYASETFRVGAATASRTHTFSLSDLSLVERLNRMGADSEFDVALVKGCMAYKSRSFSHARRYFEMTHSLLVPYILRELDDTSSRSQQEAKDDLVDILSELGIPEPDLNRPGEVLAQIRGARVSAASLTKTKERAKEYFEKYGKDEFYPSASPLLVEISRLQPDTSAARREEVVPPEVPAANIAPADLELAKDFDRAVERLIQDNPGLDSESIACRRNDDGVVESVTITFQELRDISGLATLKGLRSFSLRHWSHREAAPLSDLSPLRGLPLTSLDLSPSRVSDLEALEDAPLRELDVHGSGVRDLTPIAKPSLISLDVSDTRVFDFAPVGRCKALKRFAASDSQLKTLSFLRGIELESLIINNTKVFDFSPIGSMPLKELRVSGTQIRSIALLRRCPLERLEAKNTNVSDLGPVLAFSETLQELQISGSPIRSFLPLKKLNLERLYIADTSFSTLSLIQHMSLSHLDLSETKVTSLEALDVRSLEYLNIEDTEISSIDVLDGSPIETLYMRKTGVHNFRPIYDLGIEKLKIDDPGSKWSLFEKLPKLTHVNGRWMKGDPPF